MAKENMYDSVFEMSAKEPEAAAEDPVVTEKPVQAEKPKPQVKPDGLFCLKDLPEQDRKPTTIIFSKKNLAFLKKMAIDENLNMSECVNRWLEGLQEGGLNIRG